MEHKTHINNVWQVEVMQLLSQPLVAGRGAYREGKMTSVRVAPRRREGETSVDLSVSIRPRHIPAPTEAESEADRGALAAFLEGLEDADYHIRIAACEALGQLAHPSARPALHAAERDENHSIRAAAANALAVLDTPRLRMEDLAGIQIVLWQQVQHLAKPISTNVTDQRGHMRFVNIPADAVCRLQLLGVQRRARVEEQGRAQPPLRLPALKKATGDLAAQGVPLAAMGGQRESATLPLTREMSLEDGRLIWTIYRNAQGQVVLGFRSDAPQLQHGWVHFTVVGQSRQEEAVSEFVALATDARGILTGQYILSEALSLEQGYEIHCEPVPAPPWERE